MRRIEKYFRQIFFAALLCISIAGFGQKAPFAVVELFTSEGCSSCPPADLVLYTMSNEFGKKGSDVFFLEYHVDYWNKLGWKDPFSKFQFTIRQENYSRVLAEKEVYTPELIVNGKKSMIGSKEGEVRNAIQSALNEKPDATINAKVDSSSNDSIYISYSLDKPGKNFTLRVAITTDSLKSKITSGENAGKTLTHHHVVRYFTSIDSPLEKGTVVLPNKIKSKHDIIFFLQNKRALS